jgi:protein SCO1/2
MSTRTRTPLFWLSRALFLVGTMVTSGCASRSDKPMMPSDQPAASSASTRSPRSPLDESWLDEDNHVVSLEAWRGSPVIVTMFYRTCQVRCPMTLEKLHKMDAAFAKTGEQVHIVLVTLDPDNDTTERLASFRKSHSLPKTSWHFLRGDRSSTQALSRYLRIHAAHDDRHIDHDVQIGVLNAEGVLVARYAGWDFDDDGAVAVAMRP